VTLQIRLLLVLFLLPIFAVQAETYTGTVVRVLDGDTAEVLDASDTPHKVRLAGIDAPERKQPFGTKAKQELLSLVGGRQVTVDWTKTDRYGRQVGKLIVEGKDANLAMVAAGLAWWYRKYASEQDPAYRDRYESAETKARAAHLGLWADSAPVAPWDWRHQGEAASSGAACPCGSGTQCTGPKGGQFCITENGEKNYQAKEHR
jgi:endonuclease YncB( thermonuclease family)